MRMNEFTDGASRTREEIRDRDPESTSELLEPLHPEVAGTGGGLEP